MTAWRARLRVGVPLRNPAHLQVFCDDGHKPRRPGAVRVTFLSLRRRCGSYQVEDALHSLKQLAVAAQAERVATLGAAPARTCCLQLDVPAVAPSNNFRECAPQLPGPKQAPRPAPVSAIAIPAAYDSEDEDPAPLRCRRSPFRYAQRFSCLAPFTRSVETVAAATYGRS